MGLDCMYRLIAIEEFGGDQEQHKRWSKKLMALDFGVSRPEGARL